MTQTVDDLLAGYSPEVGDLVLFGVLNNESVELVVKAITPGPDFTAKLQLVDAAEGILDADTGEIPPFDSHITLPPAIQRFPSAP